MISIGSGLSPPVERFCPVKEDDMVNNIIYDVLLFNTPTMFVYNFRFVLTTLPLTELFISGCINMQNVHARLIRAICRY